MKSATLPQLLVAGDMCETSTEEDASPILLTDIDERKRAEEELRRSEARKAAILDSALDCIVTIDHDGCITEFN